MAVRDPAARAGLDRRALELLAEADAFRTLGLDRRAGLWAVKGLAPEAGAETAAPLLASMGAPAEAPIRLPAMALPAHVAEDYRTTSLSLKAHPCAFFRRSLARLGAVRAADLAGMKDGARVSVGGLVLIRQRPGTAKGVVFVTLEDESGPANAVVWRDVFTANRRTVMSAAFLVVHGRLQRASDVIHVVAERFTDLTAMLAGMKTAGGEAPRPAPIPPRAAGAQPRFSLSEGPQRDVVVGRGHPAAVAVFVVDFHPHAVALAGGIDRGAGLEVIRPRRGAGRGPGAHLHWSRCPLGSDRARRPPGRAAGPACSGPSRRRR